MKYALTIILLFFLGSSIHCQSHFIGFHGGINVSRIGSMADDASRIGPVAGLNYELRFAKIFSFQARLTYEQRGGKIKRDLFDSMQGDYYSRNYPLTTQHISLPITIGIISRKPTYISGHMGFIGSYTLGAKITDPKYQDGRYIETVVDRTQYFRAFNVMLILEGGVGTSIGNRWNLEGLVSLQTGVTTTERNLYQAYYAYHNPGGSEITIKFPDYPHVAIGLTVGLKYRLGKDAVE